MTIAFPDEAYAAVTCTSKAHLLLKQQFKNKLKACYDITHFRWLCWLSSKTISK